MSDDKFPTETLQPITDWLASEAGEAFYRLIGCHTRDHLGVAAMLFQIPRYFGGEMPMFKDDIDRWTCAKAYELAPMPDLPIETRRTIALLWNQFSAMADALAMARRHLAERLPQPQPFRPPRPPYPRGGTRLIVSGDPPQVCRTCGGRVWGYNTAVNERRCSCPARA